MTDMNVPVGTLVVVATGEVAKFFRITQSNGTANVTFKDELEPINLEDDGPAGKRPPESSRQDTDEATFAKQLANNLYKLAHQGEYDRLIVIADPQTLGQLRPSLHQEVTEKLLFEIDKTMINAPSTDIEAVIAKAQEQTA